VLGMSIASVKTKDNMIINDTECVKNRKNSANKTYMSLTPPIQNVELKKMSKF